MFRFPSIGLDGDDKDFSVQNPITYLKHFSAFWVSYSSAALATVSSWQGFHNLPRCIFFTHSQRCNRRLTHLLAWKRVSPGPDRLQGRIVSSGSCLCSYRSGVFYPNDLSPLGQNFNPKLYDVVGFPSRVYGDKPGEPCHPFRLGSCPREVAQVDLGGWKSPK